MPCQQLDTINCRWNTLSWPITSQNGAIVVPNVRPEDGKYETVFTGILIIVTVDFDEWRPVSVINVITDTHLIHNIDP